MHEIEPEGHENAPVPPQRDANGQAQPGGDRAHVALMLELMPALHGVLRTLDSVDEASQVQIVTMLAQLVGVKRGEELPGVLNGTNVPTGAALPEQPEEPPEPRRFMSVKRPQSQVERVACLGYYLARYRRTQHFTRRDLDALNTEAAEQKFSHAARDISNTETQAGYIVSAGQTGLKQMTTRGEALVEALPDRAAVKAVLRQHSFRPRRSRDSSGKRAQENGGGEE